MHLAVTSISKRWRFLTLSLLQLDSWSGQTGQMQVERGGKSFPGTRVSSSSNWKKPGAAQAQGEEGEQRGCEEGRWREAAIRPCRALWPGRGKVNWGRPPEVTNPGKLQLSCGPWDPWCDALGRNLPKWIPHFYLRGKLRQIQREGCSRNDWPALLKNPKLWKTKSEVKNS